MFCQAVWFCSSCFACSVRCPKGIDVSSIMEAVRTLQMTEDGLSVGELSAEDLASLPQIALVSHFRKLGK